MSALVVLARAAGGTVTRDELVTACWQGRLVSDDAIARTIAKIRLVARGITPPPFVLETVPKVGYRLVFLEAGEEVTDAPPPDAPVAPVTRPARRWLPAAMVAGLMALSFWLGGLLLSRGDTTNGWDVRFRQQANLVEGKEVVAAIVGLEPEQIKKYLNEGWKVDWTLDREANTALTVLPMACQLDVLHDKAKALQIAKQLVAAGANPAYRNYWGDTAYVISREGRYCGPHHPVTEYLRSITPGATADPVEKQVGARTP